MRSGSLRFSTALTTALLLLCACVPASSVKVDIARGTRDPIEFRSALVQVALHNGFSADVYSDVLPAEAPFRRLNARLGATFSSARTSKLSIQLSIAPDSNSASFWVVEGGSEKLSRETVAAADAMLTQLRAEFGANNVVVVWRSEGQAAVTSNHRFLADAFRAAKPER